MLFLSLACFVILEAARQGLACIPMRSPGGVIPITEVPPVMTTVAPTAPTTVPTTVSTTASTATVPTTTTTTAPATCPAQTALAPFLADPDFRESHTLFRQQQTCAQCEDETVSYFDSATSAQFDLTEFISAVDTSTCANLCICTESGVCYTNEGDFTFYLYSYCDATNCGMYFVFGEDETGSFVPTSGTGTTYIPDPGYTNPVTDENVYLKGSTISCTMCRMTDCF
uniref:Apple domain-containing protein n=1 Tax=Panagrellus redivivus TaxID=6233 RepID=A0A7E4VFQ0_PANRE